ncbi:MAG: hypothetical protein KQH63_21335 [Desulfobulbaceae bacterium]|nr:hypothetical protein [Desulfobulbaceae bacterium]
MKSAASAKTRTQAQTNTSVSDKIALGSIVAMGWLSAVIGAWAALCFAAALFNNGPIAMFKGVFTALTGI